MQSLFKLTREMEIKLHALLAEVQELKNKAQELEEENSRLRKDLAALYREGLCGETGADNGVPHKGFFNLLGLYDHNFHICNAYFGRKRSGDCLFCMAFLRKEQEPSPGEASGT